MVDLKENKPIQFILEEKYFENFTFNNSIHLDAIVYSKEKDCQLLNQLKDLP